MVNIISTIALVGVVVGTLALVVVISIFNGFDTLIKSFYSVFDPEIKIVAAEGKQFDPNTEAFRQLRLNKNIAHYCESIEEIAHFKFDDRQFIASIKGVSDDYLAMSNLYDHLYDGKLVLNDENFNYSIVGLGLAHNLGLSTNFVRPMFISVPKKGKGISLLNPFNQDYVFVSGIYTVKQQDVDDKYALIPLSMARKLLEMDSTVTSVEIGLANGADPKRFQKDVQKMLGSNFKVLNRYQQHESYYKVAKSERFFIFITLSFIVVIASFNLASSIAMLMLDKKKDINILGSLGLTQKRIGQIFMLEGVLVSVLGSVIGLVLGVLICLGQVRFGWLKFPGSFAIDSYPVELRFWSLAAIFVTVLTIGILASWLPVKLLPKKFYQLGDE